MTQYKPKTVYLTYTAASAEQVGDALTGADFTRRYFGGPAIEVEPRTGGTFLFTAPAGRPA